MAAANLLGHVELRKVLELLTNSAHDFNFYKSQHKNHTKRCDLPTKAEQENCVKFAKEHLDQHIKTYRIHQTAVDLYKLTAWMGMYFHQEMKKNNKNFPLIVVVNTMNFLLALDHRNLPDELLLKIAHMAANDKTNNDEWAIGKNGLYMTFRACYQLAVVSPSNP